MAFSNHLVLLITLSVLEGLSQAQILPSRANVSIPVQSAKVGDVTFLSCNSNGTPLSVCLWERLSSTSGESRASNLIVNFNIVTARPGSFSGTDGYTYNGEGLIKGQCGMKVEKVKEEDFGNWQCTLIGNNDIYRGEVELKRAAEDSKTSPSDASSVGKPRTVQSQPQGSVSIVQPERDSRQFFEFSVGTGSTSNNSRAGGAKARPIITAESPGVKDTDYSRSIGPSEAPVGLQVQEVEVQSAGLQIIQRQGRKLVIL